MDAESGSPVELSWLADDCRRVGVVVPPSNPVVEPELDALVGDDILIYSARLPRFSGMTLAQRNRMYVPAYRAALDSLCGLGVSCALVAMTGPNYQFGLDGDRKLCGDLSKEFGAPVRTASLAIHDALCSMGINRVHLMCPYPGWLTKETVDYWTSGGVEVIAVEQLLGEGDAFRAYETRTDEVIAHLTAIKPQHGSAVLLTGTGLVSVASIYQVGLGFGVPILSSNLCSAWWILSQCDGSSGSELYRQIAVDHVPTRN